MKVKVFFAERMSESLGNIEKQVIEGVVKNVYSHYTEDEIWYMWHELKATATIHKHDELSSLIKLHTGMLDALDEMFDDTFLPDEFSVMFEGEKGRFFLSFGGGIEQFGFDEKTEDWIWNASAIYLKSRDGDEICRRMNETIKERAANLTEEEKERARENIEKLLWQVKSDKEGENDN